MSKKLIVLIVAGLLPVYAMGAKLNLKQDLGGLNLAVMTDDPDSPETIKITNKDTKVAACTLSYTGADAGTKSSSLTVQPGKSGTIRVVVDASNAQRAANLKCAEKKAAAKK
jgi:hypothetical protein